MSNVGAVFIPWNVAIINLTDALVKNVRVARTQKGQ
jgi:hypothetical protein